VVVDKSSAWVVSLGDEIATLLSIARAGAAFAGDAVSCTRRHSHRLRRVFGKRATLLARVIRNVCKTVSVLREFETPEPFFGRSVGVPMVAMPLYEGEEPCPTLPQSVPERPIASLRSTAPDY